MGHESCFRGGDRAAGTSFEAAAQAHLESLETAGETPDQIVGQLSDVAASYAKDGLLDEANALREIIRQYQLKWSKDRMPFPTDASFAKIEALQQLRRVADNPPVNGRMVDGDAALAIISSRFRRLRL